MCASTVERLPFPALPVSSVLTPSLSLEELDLHTCTLNDARGLAEAAFSFELKPGHAPASGFAGWFDVAFRGRDSVAPLPEPVEFSTSPSSGYTHWGQQARSPCSIRPMLLGAHLVGSVQ